jgi:hypothetical protein
VGACDAREPSHRPPSAPSARRSGLRAAWPTQEPLASAPGTGTPLASLMNETAAPAPAGPAVARVCAGPQASVPQPTPTAHSPSVSRGPLQACPGGRPAPELTAFDTRIRRCDQGRLSDGYGGRSGGRQSGSFRTPPGTAFQTDLPVLTFYEGPGNQIQSQLAGRKRGDPARGVYPPAAQRCPPPRPLPHTTLPAARGPEPVILIRASCSKGARPTAA